MLTNNVVSLAEVRKDGQILVTLEALDGNLQTEQALSRIEKKQEREKSKGANLLDVHPFWVALEAGGGGGRKIEERKKVARPLFFFSFIFGFLSPFNPPSHFGRDLVEPRGEVPAGSPCREAEYRQIKGNCLLFCFLVVQDFVFLLSSSGLMR